MFTGSARSPTRPASSLTHQEIIEGLARTALSGRIRTGEDANGASPSSLTQEHIRDIVG